MAYFNDAVAKRNIKPLLSIPGAFLAPVFSHFRTWLTTFLSPSSLIPWRMYRLRCGERAP